MQMTEPVCIHVCRANMGLSGAPGGRARPSLADSFAGEEVTSPGDVRAEEEQLPGWSNEKIGSDSGG